MDKLFHNRRETAGCSAEEKSELFFHYFLSDNPPVKEYETLKSFILFSPFAHEKKLRPKAEQKSRILFPSRCNAADTVQEKYLFGLKNHLSDFAYRRTMPSKISTVFSMDCTEYIP